MIKTRNSRPVFYVIACLLPIFFLLLVELGLRAVGYGKTYPLFVASQHFEGYLQPNPELINRYFPDPSHAPKVSPDTVYFKRNKPEDSVRIVIQGGSTAAGFPFGRFGSLQGMLEQRVKRLYPNQKIEIINTAMAAVNTYTMLDLVDEIIEIEPDLVLIYAGHNEFLGVMGVGSTMAAQGGRWSSLAFLAVKELKLFQLLQQFYLWLTPVKSLESDLLNQGERSLMAQVAKGQRIPFDAPLFDQGVAQFQHNLSAILQQYHSANVPVLLGNLVAIEKQMPPFSSVGNEQGPAFEQFQQGQTALAQGHEQAALVNFTQARDLDELRFRAPSQFNQIIHNAAHAYDNVSLVDVEQRFRRDTRDGILGYQHLLEHVHPTERGYFLLAEAFLTGMKQTGLLPAVESANDNQSKAWLDRPVTELNRAYAALTIAQLTSGYPFRTRSMTPPAPDPNTFIFPFLMKRLKGEAWLSLQYELQKAYMVAGNTIEAARVSGVIADALPESVSALNMAGQLYMKLSDFDMAMYYQRKALDIAPTDPNSQLNLAHSLFLTQQFDASLRLLHQVQQQQPDNVRIQFFIDRVKAGANHDKS